MHATTVMLCIYCARYPDKMAWFQPKFLILIFKAKYMLWVIKSNVSMVPNEINSVLSANHLLQLILTIDYCMDRMFNNYFTSSIFFFKGAI